MAEVVAVEPPVEAEIITSSSPMCSLGGLNGMDLSLLTDPEVLDQIHRL